MVLLDTVHFQQWRDIIKRDHSLRQNRMDGKQPCLPLVLHFILHLEHGNVHCDDKLYNWQKLRTVVFLERTSDPQPHLASILHHVQVPSGLVSPGGIDSDYLRDYQALVRVRPLQIQSQRADAPQLLLKLLRQMLSLLFRLFCSIYTLHQS